MFQLWLWSSIIGIIWLYLSIDTALKCLYPNLIFWLVQWCQTFKSGIYLVDLGQKLVDPGLEILFFLDFTLKIQSFCSFILSSKWPIEKSPRLTETSTFVISELIFFSLLEEFKMKLKWNGRLTLWFKWYCWWNYFKNQTKMFWAHSEA